MTHSIDWTLDSAGALLATDFKALPKIASGKVRDIYALGDDLLLVTSDRISAFDWVMGRGIPGKGKILNRIRTIYPTAKL